MGSDVSTESVLDPRLLARIDDLSLVARLAVEGYLSGRHRSISRGYGGEFEQYRAYVPGDDVKYVDWKLFARQERVCMKVFREETDMRVAVVLDASGSMGYQGSRASCSKYRYGCMIASCLAYLTCRQGDQVGVFVHGGDGITRCVSGEQNWSMVRLASELVRRVPSGTGHSSAVMGLVDDFLKGRGMVVFISDFHGEEGELSSRLREYRIGNRDCIAIQVLDDDELDLPFGEGVTFRDSETGQEVSASADVIRGEYRAEMSAFMESVKESGLQSQSDVLVLRTQEELGKVLSWYLGNRRT